MNSNQIIPSVNFHVWEPCNMRCKFCFATFQDVKKTILPKGHLPKKESLQLVKLLADYGFRKITFAGGEPTLCPWIGELIAVAKNNGLTTMIVTNGSRIDENFLLKNRNFLDWIALSVDSLKENTNREIGRFVKGKEPFSLDQYLKLTGMIKSHGYNLKINTVVNSLNYLEDFSEFVWSVGSERWKLFQVLPIKGQNDQYINALEIKKQQFAQFIQTHQEVGGFIVESNEDIKGSYVMIDPAGRFFQNTDGCYRYSRPILKVGCNSAYKEMNYNYWKFRNRGGLYSW